MTRIVPPNGTIWGNSGLYIMDYHSHPAGASQTETVVTDLTTPDGIAVDWLHKLIYWTDTGRNTVEVADLRATDSYRLILFDTSLDEPRSIMVDPRGNQGWIYWTDWGRNPKIERSGMDGNHRQAIVTSGLQWPNGITTDYVTNKLFWVDAKLHIIMSSNLDGRQTSIILSDDQYLSHPFSISVFEDTLYWTDWQTESIHMTNKFNSSVVSTVATSLFSPMDIHVFHELKQPKDTARCENNGGCSHMCLPAPVISAFSALYTCACPNGWTLKLDGHTCKAPETTAKTPFQHVTTAEALSQGADMGKLVGIIVGGILGFVLVAVIVSDI